MNHGFERGVVGMAGGQRGRTTATKQRRAGRASGEARVPSSGAPQRQRRGSDGASLATPPLPLLRTSERSTLKMCEFLWDLTYNYKLKPQTDMPALRYGSLAHKALAGWYVPGVKRGVHPAEGFANAYDAEIAANEEVFGLKAGEDEKWVNARELGIAMMNNYVEEYGQDRDWEVIATEMPFQVMVTYPEDVWDLVDGGPGFLDHAQGDPWFYYVGVIDGVWRKRSDKTIWVPDHKTTAGIGDSKLQYLQVDDQAGSYWSWGVDFLRQEGILKPKQQLAGMLYNFLRKAMPDERASKYVNGKRLYLNLDGSVSKRQPPPYFARLPIWRDEFDRNEAKRRALVDYRRIELFRNGELEMSKNPGMFTCPRCAMRDACELHETGNDWQGFLDQTTKMWDPYAEHEVYDGR